MTRLLETMRADDGHVARLDRHLARLAASASALGMRLDPEEVRRRVAEAGVGEGPWAVRLTVGPAGDAEVRAWPLADEPMRTVWIDPEPFREAGSARCVHKTTDRDHYRRRYQRALARGADEAVLVNPAGDVSEGTRTSVWAWDGRRWLTPPLAAGGLAGIERAHLLATRPDCAVGPLAPDDLRRSEALALSNALRGWMPVRLLNPDAPARVLGPPSSHPDPP